MAVKISGVVAIGDDKVHRNTGANPVWENSTTFTSNYTITDGTNAFSAGPITINSGVTVTIGDGETWTVV